MATGVVIVQAGLEVVRAGCTLHEIAAIIGHQSLREIVRDTEAHQSGSGVPRLRAARSLPGEVGQRTETIGSRSNARLEGWLPGPDSNQRPSG